ncbi:Cytochrome P450 superfamily protein [Abortiporus biennis]
MLFSLTASTLLRDLVTTMQDALIVVGGVALTTHLIFKKNEPSNVAVGLALTLSTPLVLSIVLHKAFSSYVTAILLISAVFHGVLGTSILLYRLSPFHPLAKYPGPLLCKVGKIFFYLKAKDGQQYHYINSLHHQYGDIVRIGPNDLSIADAAAIVPVMGPAGLPRGPEIQSRQLYPAVKSLIGTRDTIQHHHRRKPWTRAFNSTALKEYAPLISHRANQLVELITAESKEKSVDLSSWFGRFTYDVMSDVIYGGGPSMLQDGDKSGNIQVIAEGLTQGSIYEHLPWLAYYAKKLPGKVNDSLLGLRKLGLGLAAGRQQRGSKTKDLFYYLNNEDLPNAEPTPAPLLVSEGVLATVAGSDTTSSTLTTEVDHFYPPEVDALDSKYYKDIPLIDAVINETLRLWPAVASGSIRLVPHGSGGKMVDKYFIPEGTHVRVHSYTVQRDPRNFSPSPEKWWPDRWLIAEGHQTSSYSSESSKSFTHNTAAFVPFSFGPANCVGKPLAIMEMRMIIAYLMQKVEMSFDESWDPSEYAGNLREEQVLLRGSLKVLAKLR